MDSHFFPLSVPLLFPGRRLFCSVPLYLTAARAARHQPLMDRAGGSGWRHQDDAVRALSLRLHSVGRCFFLRWVCASNTSFPHLRLFLLGWLDALRRWCFRLFLSLLSMGMGCCGRWPRAAVAFRGPCSGPCGKHSIMHTPCGNWLFISRDFGRRTILEGLRCR